ncbi:MAG: hypothetical protein ACOYNN_04640 [Terrimicrobiaceae bacterium]
MTSSKFVFVLSLALTSILFGVGAYLVTERISSPSAFSTSSTPEAVSPKELPTSVYLGNSSSEPAPAAETPPQVNQTAASAPTSVTAATYSPPISGAKTARGSAPTDRTVAPSVSNRSSSVTTSLRPPSIAGGAVPRSTEQAVSTASSGVNSTPGSQTTTTQPEPLAEGDIPTIPIAEGSAPTSNPPAAPMAGADSEVLLPAALVPESPSIPITNDQQVVEWEKLQDDFIEEVGGTAPQSPADRRNWISAKDYNDTLFRAKFGTQAFLQQSLEAYRKGWDNK